MYLARRVDRVCPTHALADPNDNGMTLVPLKNATQTDGTEVETL